MTKYFALPINAGISMGKHSSRKLARLSSLLGSSTLKIALISMVVVFGLAYLIEVNSIATKGFKIQELESAVARLEEENKQFDIQVAEFESSSNLEAKIADLKMVAVGKVDYLTPTGGAVAYNR